MVGFGFVYLLEYTDSSFQDEDELKGFLGCPVLGSISKIITPEDLKKETKSTVKKILIIAFLVAGALLITFSLTNAKFVYMKIIQGLSSVIQWIQNL